MNIKTENQTAFPGVLAFGVIANAPGKMVMVPIMDDLEPGRGCNLLSVVWLKNPTQEQRQAILATIKP